MFSNTVFDGNNRKSWNTIPNFLRKYGTLLDLIRVTSTSFTITVPESGVTSCESNFINVDLPAPECPQTNTNSPFSI